ncbi:hypothetical protein [Streptomyces lydicus]|uniref:hypothetical protein n=1 Tax=Streptomyces lydicus TaxID=47763 RepID=UPI0036E1F2DE
MDPRRRTGGLTARPTGAPGRINSHASSNRPAARRSRPTARPPAVRLAPGQWVRWQLNYRFSSMTGMQDWSYWLDTFNIAYGPANADVFLSTPTVFVDEQGPLR